MSPEAELYYFHKPNSTSSADPSAEFLAIHQFLADEAACKTLWDLVSSQFRTRSKFLTLWPGVRYVVVHRSEGKPDGMVLVSTPINWQIDYVVVHPDSRGKGIASAMVKTALAKAYELNAPYVMLTSREGLRPLYESCGFEVVHTSRPT